jgi:putative component of toxin-antitoxin plasmid stabilization module
MELLHYQRADGSEPFSAWLVAMRDKMAASRIRIRLRQVEAGNLGDSAAVGAGVTARRW